MKILSILNYCLIFCLILVIAIINDPTANYQLSASSTKWLTINLVLLLISLTFFILPDLNLGLRFFEAIEQHFATCADFRKVTQNAAMDPYRQFVK